MSNKKVKGKDENEKTFNINITGEEAVSEETFKEFSNGRGDDDEQ